MIQLPQLQEALLVASDGMVARSRRRAQRFRLGLMTTVAVATVGGGAVASQGLWGPVVGLGPDNRPSVATVPPPTSQQQLLGVLRRPQDAADRSSTSQDALRTLSRRYGGVHVADVRLLRSTGVGTGTSLVPVQRVRVESATQQRAAGSNRLCLYTRDAPQSSTLTCFNERQIRDGRANVVLSTGMQALVPDGVSAVRLSSPSRSPFVVRVRDNLAETPLSGLAPGTTITWLHANGGVAPFPGGDTVRRLDLPVSGAGPQTAAPNVEQHDCGATRGGVVPRTVACGPAAVRHTHETQAADARAARAH